MNIHQDFEELLKLLEKNKVRYMIVGGYAVAFHGAPRFTKDMDLFYQLSNDNIISLKSALKEFGFGSTELNDELFEKGNIVKIGIEPVRIDLLNKIDGIEFDEAAKTVVKGKYGDVETCFIGLDCLKQNKNSTGRLQDKADIEKMDKLKKTSKRR